MILCVCEHLVLSFTKLVQHVSSHLLFPHIWSTHLQINGDASSVKGINTSRAHVQYHKHHVAWNRQTVVLPIIHRAYLGLHISIVVTLEEEGGSLGVIFPCGNVQRWKADLPFGVIFQKEGNDLVMALLQRHRQRSETILWTRENGEQHYGHVAAS